MSAWVLCDEPGCDARSEAIAEDEYGMAVIVPDDWGWGEGRAAGTFRRLDLCPAHRATR